MTGVQTCALPIYKSAVSNPARNWGGRRKSLLTQEEEVAFLKPWLASAATGHLALSTTITCKAERASDASMDSRHWRSIASRFRDTTTTDTRGGSFCCSELACGLNLLE